MTNEFPFAVVNDDVMRSGVLHMGMVTGTGSVIAWVGRGVQNCEGSFRWDLFGRIERCVYLSFRFPPSTLRNCICTAELGLRYDLQSA